jgi:hypothetical protein
MINNQPTRRSNLKSCLLILEEIVAISWKERGHGNNQEIWLVFWEVSTNGQFRRDLEGRRVVWDRCGNN